MSSRKRIDPASRNKRANAASDDRTRIHMEPGRVSVGTQLSGIYELDEQLALGGMGEVYRGHNIQTGDLVAIKIMLPEFIRDQTMLDLFRKEASILNHLSHDAIVRYHVFTIDPVLGRPYLAMEFVNGESLSSLMKRGPMAPEKLGRLGVRLASALAAVHRQRVFHRDLSPDNVILPGARAEHAKIIDFGIARSVERDDKTIIGGRFAGKYNYVSPEQLGLFGGVVTERSDIYSLALVLAAAARGKPLDMNGSQWEVVEKRRSVPDLSDIDAPMRRVLQYMLEPDPADRPAFMMDVVDMIAANGPDEIIRTELPPRSQPPRPAFGPLLPGPQLAQGQGEPMRPAFVPPIRPAWVSRPRPARLMDVVLQAADKAAEWLKDRGWMVGAASIAALVSVAALVHFSGILAPPARPPVKPTALTPLPSLAVPPPPSEAVAPPPSAPVQPPPSQAVAPPPSAPVQPTPSQAVAPPPSAPVQPPSSQAVAQPSAPATPPPEPVAAVPVQPAIARPPDVIRPEPPSEQLDTGAQHIAWLRSYAGGDCFHAVTGSASGGAMEIEGFGTRVEPFEDMLKAFHRQFGIEPEVGVRVIEPAQCPITGFLRSLGAREAGIPALVLDRSSVTSGASVSGAVEARADDSVILLLIDHKGMTFNLNDRLVRQGTRATFSIPIGLSASDPSGSHGVPQVMIAIAARSPIISATLTSPAAASEVLPAIMAEMAQKGISGSATAKYFRLVR